MAKTSENNPKRFPWWEYMLIGILFIIVLMYVNWYFLHGRIAHDSLNDRGTFGDMFGVSTAFFSGAAFVGIILTIWMQKEELSLQREELKDTRKVLADQARQLETQSKTLIAQKDENTFFQMLKLHNDIVETFTYSNSIKGRDALERLSNMVISYYRVDIMEEKYAKIKNIDDINTSYLKLNVRYNNIFGPYFRSLYNMISFVNRSKLDNKMFYISVLRAQLSQSELVLLYFNCLSALGNKYFKPLVEKYGILKSISFDGMKVLGEEKMFKSFYKKGAFT